VQRAAGLKVTTWGIGRPGRAPAVLVHGSFGWGEETWEKQRPLADMYRLVLVDRRGFGGSMGNGRVDFERDADDVAALLEEGAHLVGHSYGGVVSLLAAARRPEAVRSLTVIEPPALGLARGNPVVEEFIAGVQSAVGDATDPSDYRLRFLLSFGFPARPETLTGADLEAASSSWHERPPWEAEIPLDELRGVRTLVVRGNWSNTAPRARELGGAALHAVCDVLERELDAESATFPAAHNPQLLGEPFNERLRSFWEAA
jgi:pimeloyl-ACP methyl ester carboxylesterase